MAARFTELIIDAIDPAGQARFWGAVLGWEVVGFTEGDDAIELADPAGRRPSIVFVPVTEVKERKNRVHVDLVPDGCTQAAELARLLDLGARRAEVGQGEVPWIVLADPEGNEFCLLAAPDAEPRPEPRSP